MTSFINAKLPNRKIAITLGSDRVFSIRRRDADGVEVDWGTDVQVFIKIDIDKAAPTHVSADVTGSLATIRMESTTLDTVKTGTTWRVIMSEPGVPRLETAVMVGTFERNDGR